MALQVVLNGAGKAKKLLSQVKQAFRQRYAIPSEHGTDKPKRYDRTWETPPYKPPFRDNARLPEVNDLIDYLRDFMRDRKRRSELVRRDEDGNVIPFEHAMHADGGQSLVCVLAAIFHRCEWFSQRSAGINPNNLRGPATGLGMAYYFDVAEVCPRTGERAIRAARQLGWIKVLQWRDRKSKGEYRSSPAVIHIEDKFFEDIGAKGLKKKLKKAARTAEWKKYRERDQEAKRVEKATHDPAEHQARATHRERSAPSQPTQIGTFIDGYCDLPEEDPPPTTG